MSLRARLVLTVTLVAFLALVAADLVTYTELRAVLLNEIDTALQNADAAVQATLTGPMPRLPGGPLGGPSGRPPVASGNSGDDAPLASGVGVGASGPPGGPGGAGSGRGAGGRPPPSGRSLCADNDVQGDAPGAFVEVRTPAGAVVDGDECSALVAGARSYSPQLPQRISGFHLGSDGPERLVYFSAPASERDGPGFRVRASVIAGGRLGGDELVLALPLTGADHTLGGLVDIELAVTAGALAVALALGWWLVQRELLPLRRVESTADAIAGGDFADRVPGGDARTEVGRVARALNAMLARIEEAFAERDATEAQLRASEERLRRFVGDASHELRTPIAAVSAYAELFERSAGHEEDLPRVMRGIRAETARMARLVEDLLLLARLDDRRPPRRAQVELVDVAAAAVETARTVGPAWPVRLVASEAVEVLGDEAQLRQVLDNLLANVRAHTPPGTPATVRVATDGAEAVVEVADEGPGLAPEHAARAFERFFRADTSRARSSGGAGLGLAIVRAIAEAHGGSASLSSRPGHGITVALRLPIATAARRSGPAPDPGTGAPLAGGATDPVP